MTNQALVKAKDPFRQIRGIGPAIERSLHQAGVLTFEQLAQLTPAEILDAIQTSAGLSAERIAQQDWTGQAGALSIELNEATETESTATTGDNQPEPDERQRYATFTVEFLLDEENQTRRTRIVHVQSGDETTWAGWQETRLTEFLARRARPATTSQTDYDKPRLQGFEIVPTTDLVGQHLLQDGQTFEARLDLDLGRITGQTGETFGFVATIYAKNIADTSQQVIGTSQGILDSSKQASIIIPSLSLTSGVYRLEAAVQLNRLAADSPYRVMLEGNLLQVY